MSQLIIINNIIHNLEKEFLYRNIIQRRSAKARGKGGMMVGIARPSDKKKQNNPLLFCIPHNLQYLCRFKYTPINIKG
jgi:hypothetical protein